MAALKRQLSQLIAVESNMFCNCPVEGGNTCLSQGACWKKKTNKKNAIEMYSIDLGLLSTLFIQRSRIIVLGFGTIKSCY